MAQRVTNHQSRTGDRGNVIKATHNEHEQEMEHVNKEQTPNNRRWLFQNVEVEEGKDFQDRYEQAVYEEYFSDYLNSRNEKAIKDRHKDRVQTMEQFRVNRKACPEETLFYIGNRDNLVDPDVLAAVYENYVQWHNETFPNVMLMNAYLHVDEASPHIHERKVWTAHEGDMLIINQEKALAEMGIERPEPDKKEGRRNNAKMTYTKMCREKLIELAKEQGLEIIEEPKEAGHSGKKHLQYKYERLQEQYAELQKNCETVESRVDVLTSENEELTSKNEFLISRNEELERKVQEYERALTAAEADTKETKTVKGMFGFKEKEVPKTTDELERDKAIIGAKLVLQREQIVIRREKNVKSDRERLTNTIDQAILTERQDGNERQRIAVEKARKEEQTKAEQERKQLQTERDRAVTAQNALQEQLGEMTDIALDLDYALDDVLQSYDLPEQYRTTEEQCLERIKAAMEKPKEQEHKQPEKQNHKSNSYPSLG